MPVLTRSAAKKLAQQQAVETRPRIRVQEARGVRKVQQEVVTTIVTPSATGQGTHTRWKYSTASKGATSRPYPSLRSIGLPSVPDDVMFSDASLSSIERFRKTTRASSSGHPSSSATSSVPSLTATGSSCESTDRTCTPPPAGNYKLFYQSPVRDPPSCVPRSLQRGPALPLRRASPHPELGAPGTRLTLVEDDMSAEAVARREIRDLRRAEAISMKYWDELLASKRERDRYMLGTLAQLDDEIGAGEGFDYYGIARPSHVRRAAAFDYPGWIRQSASPSPTEIISR